jgi:hypothetical protein
VGGGEYEGEVVEGGVELGGGGERGEGVGDEGGGGVLEGEVAFEAVGEGLEAEGGACDAGEGAVDELEVGGLAIEPVLVPGEIVGEVGDLVVGFALLGVGEGVGEALQLGVGGEGLELGGDVALDLGGLEDADELGGGQGLGGAFVSGAAGEGLGEGELEEALGEGLGGAFAGDDDEDVGVADGDAGVGGGAVLA